MATYTAEISWQRNGEDFLGNRYSRRHSMRFDGGAVVAGSSSIIEVPDSLSTQAIDHINGPEEYRTGTSKAPNF